MTYCKILSKHWHGGTDKNYEKTQDSQLSGNTHTEPYEYETEVLTT